MLKELKEGLLFTVWTLLLFGLAHPLFVWGIGRIFFPAEAEGSLVRGPEGTIVGSRLIGQAFSGDEYFQGRPSAVRYDATSTGGTNYGPSNGAQSSAVRDRAMMVVAREAVPIDRVPSESRHHIGERSRSRHLTDGGGDPGRADRTGPTRCPGAHPRDSRRASEGAALRSRGPARPAAIQRSRAQPRPR